MTPDNPDDVDAPQTGVPQYVVVVPATATQEEWDQMVRERYALPTPTASEVINLDDDEPIEITHANQTGAVSPPTGAKPLPGTEEFDYTNKELKAIHQTLLKARALHKKRLKASQKLEPDTGFKPNAKWSRTDWPKIESEIICLVSDVYGGYSHPDAVMYPGRMKRRYQRIATALEGVRKAWEGLSPREQWHLSEQFVPRDYHKFPKDLNELLRVARQAQERPPHEMTANLQYSGSPKNHGIRLIVEELLRIFQRVTGNEPILYASSITHDGSKYRCKGNCYAFLVACVAPTRLVARRYLGSTLLAVYRDWKDEKHPVKASKARPKKKK